VNQNVEDEAAAGAAAGAEARVTCDVSTLRGTYVYRDHGVYSNTGEQFAGAGREYFDGNGTVRGKLTSNVNGAISRESFQGTYEVNPDCTGRSTYPGTLSTSTTCTSTPRATCSRGSRSNLRGAKWCRRLNSG
jgi:hypothetical protein